ncbi:MAG: DNA-3-methyladenine glycosylase [Patescibacteria group bacterium]
MTTKPKATISDLSSLPDLSSALTAAAALLGWMLIHDSPDGLTAGYIVETEAYMADDAASHTFRGESARNKIMFGPPGYLYVYFTYGMHYCVNIVTSKTGNGEAVLIRALQPMDGIELMRKRRNKQVDLELASGPAKMAQAMGINKTHNGASLLGKDGFTLKPGPAPKQITQTTRVGISQAKNKLWRFYITDNPYVSKK